MAVIGALLGQGSLGLTSPTRAWPLVQGWMRTAARARLRAYRAQLILSQAADALAHRASDPFQLIRVVDEPAADLDIDQATTRSPARYSSSLRNLRAAFEPLVRVLLSLTTGRDRVPAEEVVMVAAIILFALAAAGGAVMAAMRLRGRPTLPLGLALAHGALAAAGLVALIWAVASGLSAKTPLVLFVIAALGGFALFSFQIRNKAIPVGVMMVHALVAVLAFVLLLLRL